MQTFGFTVAGAFALTVTAFDVAGIAARPPTGCRNAVDSINELEADGYNMQITGDVPSECTSTASAIRPRRESTALPH